MMVSDVEKFRVRLGCAVVVVVLVAAFWPGRARGRPYRDYTALREQLESIARREPNLVRVDLLARSLEERGLWLAEVGQGSDEQRRTRPAVLVVAGIEGDDLIGSAIATSWIEELIEQYGQDPNVTNLLNTTTLYVIPRLNPDPAESFFAVDKIDTKVNSRPRDDDHDGLIDEDGPEDLNGDGLVTWMRVLDARGEYALDDVDDRLLVKADPTEGQAGAWRYLREGIDNDRDGQWNEDAPGGVNLNRNFPYGYEFFTAESGLHPVSENETRALADFVVAHPNIGIVVTYGAADNVSKCPKADDPPRRGKELTALDEDDAAYFGVAGELYRKTFGLKKELEGRALPGTFSDWIYFDRGRLSLAVRPWNLDMEIELSEESKDDSDKEEDGDRRGGPEHQQLEWFDRHVPDAFVAWQPFEHPDWPGRKVEIGGYQPFVRTNPPADRVRQLTAQHADFLTALAEKLPRIGLREATAKHLGNDVFEVTLCLENKGFLPTVLAHGVRSKNVFPTRVTLNLHDDHILSGRRITYLAPIPGSGGIAEARYVVHASDARQIEFTVVSALAGQFCGAIELPKEQ